MAALEAERGRLLAQIAGLEQVHDDVVEATELVSTDDEHDPEGATIAFERAQVAALLRDSHTLLAEVDAALDRSAAGTYGRCSACGGAIGDARLAVLPAATHCVRCAV